MPRLIFHAVEGVELSRTHFFRKTETEFQLKIGLFFQTSPGRFGLIFKNDRGFFAFIRKNYKP